MKIGVIDQNTFSGFQKMVREYLPDTQEDELLSYFEKFPWSYCGLFDENNLIGVIFGWENPALMQEELFVLQGIAIDWDHKANGLGGILLKHWEKKASDHGYRTIGVGSADGYVEGFYLKNGYLPKQYKAFDNQGRAHVKEISSIEQYESLDRNAVIRAADGNKGFVVFEKNL